MDYLSEMEKGEITKEEIKNVNLPCIRCEYPYGWQEHNCMLNLTNALNYYEYRIKEKKFKRHPESWYRQQIEKIIKNINKIRYFPPFDF